MEYPAKTGSDKLTMVGAEGSKPIAKMQSTLGEIKVSHGSGNVIVLWSLTQETPATTPQGP